MTPSRQAELEAMASKHMEAAPAGPMPQPKSAAPMEGEGGGETWELPEGFTATMVDEGTILITAPSGESRQITREAMPEAFDQVMALKEGAPPEGMGAEMTEEAAGAEEPVEPPGEE